VLFFFFTKSTPQQTNNPTTNPFANSVDSNQGLEDFSARCFKTYVSNYIAKQNSASDSPQLNQFAQSCFTSNFINQWATIANESDSDPVLLSQDYYNSWETDATVSVLSQSSTDATELVNLGTGSETLQLIAQLQMTPNGWRISDISSPSQH
jgi:hypothetical protein